MSRIIRVVAIIAMIGFLAYLGACAYANFIAKDAPTPENPSMPDAKTAPYSFLVKNTGTVILSNEYEEFGDKQGERTFILRGYYELVGTEFIYRSQTLTLQEAVFGPIIFKKRN